MNHLGSGGHHGYATSEVEVVSVVVCVLQTLLAHQLVNTAAQCQLGLASIAPNDLWQIGGTQGDLADGPKA